MDVQKLLAGIEAAARKAGRIMLEAEDIRATVTEKEGHGNFVTAYDRRVQAYLSEALAALLPEASFIGEEDGAEYIRIAAERLKRAGEGILSADSGSAEGRRRIQVAENLLSRIGGQL
jgi:fructose-1,6-bisphosphatase/inositol monophosphatase family enzyme